MGRGTMIYVAFISLAVTIFQVKAAAWIFSKSKSNICHRRQTQRYVSNVPIHSLTHTGRTNDATKDDKKKIDVIDGNTNPIKKDTTTDTQTNIHDNDDNDTIDITIISPYLVHNGKAVSMIKRCVSIEGLSVASGWTPQATEAFKVAIEALIRMNPIFLHNINTNIPIKDKTKNIMILFTY